MPRIGIDVDELYPWFSVELASECDYFYAYSDLSEEECADLMRVQKEFWNWQKRLEKIIDDRNGVRYVTEGPKSA